MSGHSIEAPGLETEWKPLTPDMRGVQAHIKIGGTHGKGGIIVLTSSEELKSMAVRTYEGVAQVINIPYPDNSHYGMRVFGFGRDDELHNFEFSLPSSQSEPLTRKVKEAVIRKLSELGNIAPEYYDLEMMVRKARVDKKPFHWGKLVPGFIRKLGK